MVKLSRAGALATAALLAAVALGCAVPGGGPDNPPPNRPPAPPPMAQGCDVTVHPPAAIPWEGGIGEPPVPLANQKIIGGVTAICDVVPAYHVVKVSLEEQTGGAWVPVQNAIGFTYVQCTELPGPGVPVVCEHIVSCRDGLFRTVATVEYIDEIGHGTFSPPERPETQIRCPDVE